MAIVSSSYDAPGPATDRRHVVERFTDHTGQQYMQTYWAEPNANLDTALAAHADQLELSLAASEVEDILGG